MLKPATVKALLEFRRERAWEQFHDPRNLAAAIAIEAGELQELFLWSKDSEVAQRIPLHTSPTPVPYRPE